MSDGYRTICADPPWTPTLGATWTVEDKSNSLS
jgi:hypothetical protein